MRITLTILLLLCFTSLTYSQTEGKSDMQLRSDELQKGTKIYPVPVKPGYGFINIESIREIKRVRITNIIGQQIVNMSFDYSTQNVKIETGTPPPGIYLVNIEFTDDTRVVKKIVFE